MVLKALSPIKKTKKSVPKIEAEIYLKVTAGDLLVYAAYYAGAENNAIGFEDALTASFLLFPKRFALKQLAKWPDSAMVGRRLGECKAKGLLKGNHDIGYTLTFKGARLAEKVAIPLGLAPKKKKVVKKKPVVVAKPAAIKKKSVVKKKTIKAAPKKQAVKKAEIKHVKQAVKKLVKPNIKPTAIKAENTNKAVVKNKPVEKTKAIKPINKKAAAKVKTSKPVKPAAPKTIKKKVTPKPQEIKTKPQPKKKPAVKISASEPLKPIAPKADKKKIAPKSEEIKTKHQPKKTPVAKSKASEPVKPVVKKTVKNETASQPKEIKAQPQPKKKPVVQQLSLPLSQIAEPAEIKAVKQETVQAKKAPEVKPSKKKIEKQARPIWSEPASPPPPNVSAELKARAAKFVKSMERSDAYSLFKKNGADAKISEFDFRSMLLCTMESSPETLVKNTAMFREYASIQKRQDLILFLEYCSARFAPLFVPEKKRKK